ncbi:hypothetical protein TVAG_001690 [Trichomonas vaginalis G3]|uniref:ArsA/GET3 Anion-transporting ATPase-like domain-containing protein n=1 Tax=Trichomonas vaginalis (strain ATCC PRA-98 / G3) TaxID=412133 RepID=A2FSX7_TRIV3|nr:ATPase protein [Trichomonas vaginalis G3]EAX91999.1 hypothetical protein TVAG_001690 [Trichomonas vaginalis G3]KAI5528954.1 ATPase protein [Trichomonas vaginalis G3]|eukprot:XP_001304929.1 hypothetical protein [Trichomonas vaginalis G3]
MSSELPFLDSPTYKWIMVGGKGGVGKTSTSCSIAIALAKKRQRVLLISTDPASNIGDAFQQHFTSSPTLVNGFTNLWAMEAPETISDNGDEQFEQISSMPGIDEFNALTQLFNSVDKDDYDVVVYDTAPTGHTMRLLQLPTKSFFTNSGLFNPSMLSSISSLLGPNFDVSDKFNRLTSLMENARKRLTNPQECTFVCVLLPEFLPLYETERLITFLQEQNIESHCLVVNQVLQEQMVEECPFCHKRYLNQQKYLTDIEELYGEEFRIAKIPLLDEEVKGIEAIKRFSEKLAPLMSPQ